MYASLTFSTIVTTADESVIETAVASDVSGDLQLQTVQRVKGEQIDTSVEMYAFYPARKSTAIVKDLKAESATAEYVVEAVEEYDDHQEITLRKVNA